MGPPRAPVPGQPLRHREPPCRAGGAGTGTPLVPARWVQLTLPLVTGGDTGQDRLSEFQSLPARAEMSIWGADCLAFLSPRSHWELLGQNHLTQAPGRLCRQQEGLGRLASCELFSLRQGHQALSILEGVHVALQGPEAGGC